ncbi:MAG: hypothetical protein PHX83_06795 [Acidobacteriia bacterium]|nr:hypothetical protein [Terriglobia bacterium]
MAIRVSATRVITALDTTKLDGIEALADVTDATNVAAAGAVMDSDMAGTTAGHMMRTGAGAYAVIQDNLVAVVPPTVASDSAAGYAVGSKWFDTVTAIWYRCQSAAVGAAIWIPEVRHNLGSAADPAVGDDTADGYAVGSLWVNTTAVPPRVYECTNPAAGAAVWRRINPLNNFLAVVPPAVGDDDTLGYDIGSLWVDTATDLAYTCTHNATGAAVWRLTMNVVAAGGELAGAYPNPTVADGVIDAANGLAGAVAGIVVDKGVPSSCVIAFDNAAGAAQRPADGASYTFSIGGVALATLEARDVVVDQDDFLRSSAGVEEDDTILMAAAFAACINAHTVIGLRIHADVYGGANDGRWYVECRTILQADITAASALTCVLAGGQPGVYQARATAVAASKRQLFPFRYAVTAQDVLAGEIRFSFGCSAIVAYGLDILTAATNYTRIAWAGAVDLTAGRLTIDNSGGTDWAAGNILTGWVLGTVL